MMAGAAPVGEDRCQRIKALVEGLFPRGVAVAVADPAAEASGELFHVEHSVIEGAVPARRREFLAGRAAARTAQQALGHAPRPVVPGPDRAPAWPEGLCGSISHAGGVCIAVVSDDPAIASLGLDIEENAPLPDDIFDTVLHLREQHWVNRQDNPGQMARLMFGAKECAYKAQYPLSQQLFGFDALAILPNLAQGTFEARFTRPVPPFSHGSRLAGRLLFAEGLIITAIALPA